MPIELKVPEVGESITEVEVGEWLKKPGDKVQKDDSLVSLESEKATMELPAPAAGAMGRILKKKGEMANVGEVIGYLEESATQPSKQPEKPVGAISSQAGPSPSSARGPDEKRAEPKRESKNEAKVTEAQVTGTPEPDRIEPPELVPKDKSAPHSQLAPPPTIALGREEEVVPMSRFRRTVAERLVEAQHTAALLTTFNEIDMSEVISLRKEYGEAFHQKHNVKLGFMSFFVKAAIEALKSCPAVNAEVRDTRIVYHNYFDIGIAVGGGKGLAVPVLRNAERLSFAEIEEAIGDFAARAKENKLKVDELQGGTFTISNGGVYGSLLSTPIINPPQSGVLGMHAIQPRPIAHENNVVIRPMMYVALTYDHRIVDGREAVTFLKRIKETIEKPARILIEA
jgi:2-oxoglutarate dehydrogenase E2 component (dihydrolipoamide succinyltransferase)